LFDLSERRFVWYFHFVGWTCISAGFHVDFASPNVELHVPFGFFRIGWQGVYGSKRRFFTLGRDWFRKSWFTIR
jgi:hypothetical protein